jgi:hypothetical protein
VTELEGMFDRPGKTVSVDERNGTIAVRGAAAAERSASSDPDDVPDGRDIENDGKSE